jgi:hypothetical protein
MDSGLVAYGVSRAKYRVISHDYRIALLQNFSRQHVAQHESIDAKWTRLSSLALRVVLTRKDISYADLAKALTRSGVRETARSVEGKIQRGAFSFAFFLHCLKAANADCPPLWVRHMQTDAPRADIARQILVDAMSTGAKLDFEELSRRLDRIGFPVPAKALRVDIKGGNFSFRLLLQCAAVIPMTDIAMFVDLSDLRAAASGEADQLTANHINTDSPDQERPTISLDSGRLTEA